MPCSTLELERSPPAISPRMAHALCEGVLECAVIGVPDAKQGEAIKVFVVKEQPNLSEEDVAKYCQQNLTGYKRPKYIEFRDDLPKSNVGKVLRRELRSGK